MKTRLTHRPDDWSSCPGRFALSSGLFQGNLLIKQKGSLAGSPALVLSAEVHLGHKRNILLAWALSDGSHEYQDPRRPETQDSILVKDSNPKEP